MPLSSDVNPVFVTIQALETTASSVNSNSERNIMHSLIKETRSREELGTSVSLRGHHEATYSPWFHPHNPTVRYHAAVFLHR
jgi:hypothetical protein